MMNVTISPEAVEHLCNTLRRDYRNLRKAVMSEGPDFYTLAMLNRLNDSIEEAQKIIKELSAEQV